LARRSTGCQRVHHQRKQGDDADHEEGSQYPAARRIQASRQARAAEPRQPHGQRRIFASQLALYLSEDALLFHGKRHGATSAQRTVRTDNYYPPPHGFYPLFAIWFRPEAMATVEYMFA
jgi:hypothetical protein